jgi:hypothetical protein
MRRIAVTVGGSLLLLAGAALLILPGPGIPLIIAGLAVLATEFAWAQRWLHAARERMERARARVAAWRARGASH